MVGEERGSQQFQTGEKVYPSLGGKLSIHILIVVGCLILAIAGLLLRRYAVQIAVALWDVALRSTVNNFRNFGLGVAIFFPGYLVVYFIWFIGGYPVKEIAFSKEGMVFRRGHKPIVIQRVTELKETRGGRIVKLTGLTPEGNTVTRKLNWSDVGRKRWEEFKEDLQKIKASA